MAPRIRVVNVITKLTTGGAQETAILGCGSLDRDRFEPLLITGPHVIGDGDLRPLAASLDVPVMVLPSLRRSISPLADARAVWGLARVLRRSRPDVVHTHSSKAGVVGRLAARLANVPVVIHTVHGWSFNSSSSRLGRWAACSIERLLARITTTLVVVTERDREKGLRERIGTRGQYVCVRSGIDLGCFTAAGADDRRRARQLLAVDDEVHVIGTVTRLYPQKDPLATVRAAARVMEHDPAAHLVIVGDGPLRADVEREIARHGISARTQLLGMRDDVADLLPAFDVFVLSSLWEGLPRVLVEAMATRLPVVATDVDGVGEIVIDDRTGLLVPPARPDRMADAIESILTNEELRRRLAEHSPDHLAEFHVTEMAARLSALYEGASRETLGVMP